jgi:diguanylate cyclase
LQRFTLPTEQAVVSLVLAIGIVNLALGYLAAAALVEPPPWSGWQLRWPQFSRWPQQAADANDESDLPAADADFAADIPPPSRRTSLSEEYDLRPAVPPTLAGIDELPRDWLNQLAAQGIVAQSFVEGTAHVLRLEVGRYREQLIAAENRSRALIAAADGVGLAILIEDLRFVNQDWLEKQTAAAEMLAKRAGRLGDHEAAAEALEQVLLDQAAQVRAVGAALQALDAKSEAESGGKRLLEQIALLVDHAHALRDRMLDLLATLLRAGQRIAELGPTCQIDQTTGLPSRIGVELVLSAWWREDQDRSRPLSVVLIDIDRFARVNQRLGTRAGDRAIAAVGRVIDETIRKDRGYDRLSRIGGELFAVVMGDTGPHQALTAAERLRQTVEAISFDDEGAQFELTLSCGVIEVGRTETATGILRRGTDTLRYAKKAGRNRCSIDEGSGPTTLDPPQFPVKGRVVTLGGA